MKFRTLRRSKSGIEKLKNLQNGTFSGTARVLTLGLKNRNSQKLTKTSGTLLRVSLTIRLSLETQTD